MNNKHFAEKLNNELDSLKLPAHNDERIDAFSRLLKIPKFKAESLLSGAAVPDEALLKLLGEELEVNSDWLIGKSDSRLPEKSS